MESNSLVTVHSILGQIQAPKQISSILRIVDSFITIRQQILCLSKLQEIFIIIPIQDMLSYAYYDFLKV